MAADDDLLVGTRGAADLGDHVGDALLLVGDVEVQARLGGTGTDVIPERQAALEVVRRLGSAERLEERLRVAVIRARWSA